MKTERRHELQTNELAEWVGKHYKTVAPYGKSILAVAIALLVGYSAWTFINSSNRKKEAAEWEHVDGTKEELNGLIERNSIGTPLVNLARLKLADLNLSEGLETLLTARAEALRLIKAASEDYASVANNTKDPTISQLAWCGKAKSEEALGNIKDAITDYERLLGTSKVMIFNDYAKQRIADLKRPSVKDFYTVLAETQARPPEPPKKPESDEFGRKGIFDSAVEKSSIFGKIPGDDKKTPPGTTPEFPVPGVVTPDKIDDKAPATPKTPDAAPETPAVPETPAAPKSPATKTPATPATKTPKK